jgi:hypothetical protein
MCTLWVYWTSVSNPPTWSSDVLEIDVEEKTLVQQLREALEAAQAHLEYCGYGDSWEREVSQGLPQQIQAALNRAIEENPTEADLEEKAKKESDEKKKTALEFEKQRHGDWCRYLEKERKENRIPMNFREFKRSYRKE